MRDGPLRRGLKAIARARFAVDVRATRALRSRLGGPAPYVLGGDCRRCARCCEAPAVQASRAVFYLASLRVPFLWWQRHVNGFVLVRREAAARTFVFECTHFDRATRACDSYESRPGMCRDYPRLLLDQPFPEMLPGCGYLPRARNAIALQRALDAQPLTPEQRARLTDRLRLQP